MPDGTVQLGFRSDVAEAALGGLLAEPKTLPSKLFYDDIGCALFEQITRLPEYYVTRVEMTLLREIVHQVIARLPDRAVLVEYGASSEMKASILLRALARPAGYVPIDVAGAAVNATALRLRDTMPRLPVWPIEADFLAPLVLPGGIPQVGRVGFFPGSTIGNLEPSVAVRFLGQARETLGRGAMFLIGADLRKDASMLIPAYADADGVTADFNLNMLVRLNREAAANFAIDRFAHRAVWNAAEGRIEMHLVSLVEQTVQVGGRAIVFAEGETIHTENSYKHTRAGFISLALEGGWNCLQVWTDPDALFAIYLMQVGEDR